MSTLNETIGWLVEAAADDHLEYSKATHLINQLKDMPNRVIEAAILELEVELAERDPNYEKDMGDG